MSKIFDNDLDKNRKPWLRDDFSPYLTHMIREKSKKRSLHKLFKILKDKNIRAVNPNCYFGPKITKGRFDKDFQDYFNTVSFTEIPVPYLRDIVGRSKMKIPYSPYGIVFYKKHLIKNYGTCAEPALYINTNDDDNVKYWKKEFTRHFKGVTSFKQYKRHLKDQQDDIDPMWSIKRFALTTKIDNKIDFHWEREWRHHLDFNFDLEDIAGIVVYQKDGLHEFIDKHIAENIPIKGMLMKESKFIYKVVKQKPIFEIRRTKSSELRELLFSVRHLAFGRN